MSLPISTFVDVSTQINAGTGLANNFGMGLLLVDTPDLDVDQRIELFTSSSQVATRFDKDTDDAHKSIRADAVTWFSANPKPKNLYIGRWQKNSSNAGKYRFKGNPIDGKPSATSYVIQIGDATGNSFVDLPEITIESSDTTYTKIAEKIGALVAFESVEYDPINKRFEFIATTNITIRAKTTTTETALGIPKSTYLEGVAETSDESAEVALSECLGKISETSAPSIVMCGSSIGTTYNSIGQSTLVELAKACEAEKLLFSVLDDQESARKDSYEAGKTRSLAEELFGLGHQYTMVTHAEGDGNRPDIGLAALLSSQNFDLPGSIITTHLKGLPGCTPTAITPTEHKNLQSKRCNAYTTVGGIPVLVGGYATKNGSWADAIYWLRWLKNEVELSVFNAQYRSPRFNALDLEDALRDAMYKASRTGGIGRMRRFTTDITTQIRNITGDNSFTGMSVHGYHLWVAKPGERSALDNANRRASFRIWITPSEAIHKVTGDITLGG